MTRPFDGKRILLGVSGSIAAYKAVDLASKLTQAGALVDVLMTQSAQEFVTPLTFRSITHRPVLTTLFDLDSPEAIEHVALAKQADIMVVAPATANIIAKLAWGFADDPVSITWLASDAPRVVAPAMDGDMWNKQQTFDNVEAIRAQGAMLAGPGRGRLASGIEGPGRMAEVPELMARIAMMLGRNGDLAERRIVVSAGGTQEPIDPVRVVANRSSGKMGYAIAEAARDRGAQVVLVTGPTALPDLTGVRTIKVETAGDLRDGVLEACFEADALIMAAAVADYRPAEVAGQKIKKGAEGEELVLRLVQNADFFRDVPEGVLRVGFAAESSNLLENAMLKMREKGLELIAANDITEDGSGFGADTNRVTLLRANGRAEELPLLPKYDVAWELLDRVRDLLDARPEQVRALPS